MFDLVLSSFVFSDSIFACLFCVDLRLFVLVLSLFVSVLILSSFVCSGSFFVCLFWFFLCLFVLVQFSFVCSGSIFVCLFWFYLRMFVRSGPEVIKLFLCSTQLSMKFVLLMNLKLLTIANSFFLNIAEHEIIYANKYENANYCLHFFIYIS